jgi:hypothetical protein
VAFARRLRHLRPLAIYHDAAGSRRRVGIRRDVELNGTWALTG